MTSAKLHHVNLIIAIAVTLKDQLFRRETSGTEIVGWRIGKLVQFAVDAHDKDLGVALDLKYQ